MVIRARRWGRYVVPVVRYAEADDPILLREPAEVMPSREIALGLEGTD